MVIMLYEATVLGQGYSSNLLLWRHLSTKSRKPVNTIKTLNFSTCPSFLKTEPLIRLEHNGVARWHTRNSKYEILPPTKLLFHQIPHCMIVFNNIFSSRQVELLVWRHQISILRFFNEKEDFWFWQRLENHYISFLYFRFGQRYLAHSV